MIANKIQFDPHAYSITVRRTIVDDELLFVATVAELPSVSAIADSHSDAYEYVVDAIATLHKSASQMGHRFPDPMTPTSVEHSGRVTLRMPPWLHVQLELEAQRDNMSLNQTIITLLASKVTAQEIVRNATSTISATAKTAITAAALMRGESTSSTPQDSTVGYSAIDFGIMPTTENEKWTQRH